MLWIFRAITDRLKALFVSDVALEFETQFIARQADRKAELLLKAEQYENQGLDTVATELRERAEAICLERPLAAVLPAITEWQGEAEESTSPARLEVAAGGPASDDGSRTESAPVAKKKSGKKRRAARQS